MCDTSVDEWWARNTQVLFYQTVQLDECFAHFACQHSSVLRCTVFPLETFHDHVARNLFFFSWEDFFWSSYPRTIEFPHVFYFSNALTIVATVALSQLQILAFLHSPHTNGYSFNSISSCHKVAFEPNLHCSLNLDRIASASLATLNRCFQRGKRYSKLLLPGSALITWHLDCWLWWPPTWMEASMMATLVFPLVLPLVNCLMFNFTVTKNLRHNL